MIKWINLIVHDSFNPIHFLITSALDYSQMFCIIFIFETIICLLICTLTNISQYWMYKEFLWVLILIKVSNKKPVFI